MVASVDATILFSVSAAARANVAIRIDSRTILKLQIANPPTFIIPTHARKKHAGIVIKRHNEAYPIHVSRIYLFLVMLFAKINSISLFSNNFLTLEQIKTVMPIAEIILIAPAINITDVCFCSARLDEPKISDIIILATNMRNSDIINLSRRAVVIIYLEMPIFNQPFLFLGSFL